jgi:hypothetical protein
MALSDGVKKQLRISGWIVVAYVLALFLYLQDDYYIGMMTGDSVEVSSSVPYTELPWEILVLDPENRMKLWARYDKSPERERENAFLAVIHVLDAMTPEQAEHLAKNLLEKSGQAPDRGHRKKLLEMLERLGSQFKVALKHIAGYSAKTLSLPLESLPRKKDVHDMMNNIALETKDTGYKYCLQGTANEISRCAEQMAEEKHPKTEEHFKNVLNNLNEAEARGAILIVVGKHQMPFGKEYVPKLLDSGNAYDIKIALRLIREYELVEYRKDVQNLRKSKFESVIQDVDQTLSYLATRSPASR